MKKEVFFKNVSVRKRICITDGKAYIYCAGGGPGSACAMRVNSDMTGVNGDAVTIDAPDFFESAFMQSSVNVNA
jgi:hypothetical protein